MADRPQRKRAQDPLRTWADIFEPSGWGCALSDPSGDILTLMNPAFARMYGYTTEEFTGKPLASIFAPDSRDQLPEHVRIANEQGHHAFESKHIRKDGTTFPVQVDVVAMKDENGRVLYLTACLQDITERKRMEEALRESEERYRSLYNRTPAMLHSIDACERLVTVSDQWLEVLGYGRDEVIGHKSVEFLTEESRRHAETVTLPEFWKTGYARDISYQFVKKSGEVADVLLSAVVERDGAGNVVRTLAVLNDVTERKRLEQELQWAREELEGKVERQMVRRNPYGLTFREFTVLHLVAAGRADKEIARELVISPLTVHKHVANILGKMNAASRTEAGIRALREGLLD